MTDPEEGPLHLPVSAGELPSLSREELEAVVHRQHKQVLALQEAISEEQKKIPLAVIAENAPQLGQLVKEISSEWLQHSRTSHSFNLRMTTLAVAVVLVVVAASGFLTWTGQLDGSTFAFLLGLIVGYILTFIRQSIAPEPE